MSGPSSSPGDARDPDRIPADRFFDGDAPPEERAQRHRQPPVPASEESSSQASVSGSAFYERDPPADRQPLDAWALDPRRQAAVFALAGFMGVFVEQANVLFQIVVGAPVFEELFKFGVALGVVSLLRVPGRVPRFLLAALVGAGFGGLEHAVTYPDEATAALRFRIGFHAATPALSMAVYDAVASLENHRTRWAATLPATAVHWLNNFVAVLLGFASVAAGDIVEGPALVFAQIVAATTIVLAVLALAAPGLVRRGISRLWRRLAPAAIRDPAAVSPPGTGSGSRSQPASR